MSLIRDLARRIARRDSSVRVPKSPTTSFHQGTLTGVDPNTGTVTLKHNGTDVEIPGMRYLVAYTPDHQPAPTDVVWWQLHGTDPLIFGKHSVPNNEVTFPAQ